MRTTVWFECVCRLLDFHRGKDGRPDYADWMFEGGMCNLPAPPGVLSEAGKQHVYHFQVPCSPVLQKFKTEDGKEYSVVCFRPLRGAVVQNLQLVEE